MRVTNNGSVKGIERPGRLVFHRIKYKTMKVYLFLLALWYRCKEIEGNKIPEDALLNFTSLVKKYGHVTEEHNVITEDGYILKLFHIPGKSKLPVFFMHGLGDSSDSGVIRGYRSIAITLANRGYDVWLGNNRGNKYSRRHVSLNPDKDKAFWDYSFHEIGVLDLPAMIDFIFHETVADKIDVIAHSQGTSAFFALLSSKPEYNEKINLLVALGPVAFLANLAPPTSTVALAGPLINQFLLSLGVEEIAANETSSRKLQTLLCSQGFIGGNVCRFGLIFTILGFDPKRLEAEFAPIVLAHFPAGLSRKSLLHYDQLFFSKRFAHYDYGTMKNLEIYQSLVPPDYDLKKVTTKVALFLGRNDPFAKIKDAEHLKELLPNTVFYTIMKPRLWSHGDFLLANDMASYLFPFIFDLLNNYYPGTCLIS